MFYTKYRPQKFADLVGLEAQTKTLLSALEKGKVGHAYFFSGPRGSGKTTMARLLAKAVNCTERENSEPCGKCKNCEAIQEDRHLDLIEIDAASNRGIDDIRSLREKIRLAPSQAKYKVYIIDEVHMLTTEAFNALLKTLEEPPAHAIFVLCTTEPHKVPETIRSRCQRFEFKRANSAQLLKKLKKICKEEEAEVSDQDLGLIIKAANGGYRDAETYLEQVIVGGQSVKEVLGTLQADAPEALLDFIIKGESRSALLFVNKLFDEGANLAQFNHDFLDYLRQIMLVRAGVGEELIEATEDQYEKMRDQAAKLPSVQVNNLIEEFSKAEGRMKDAMIPQLPLELAVLSSLCHPEPSDSEGEGSPQLQGDSSVSRVLGIPQNDEGIANCEVTLRKITDCWNEFLEKLKPLNHSLSALLRSARPKEYTEDGTLVLEMFYKFHKERVESAKNRKLLEKTLSEVLAMPIKIQCALGKNAEYRRQNTEDKEKPKGGAAARRAANLYNGRIETE